MTNTTNRYAGMLDALEDSIVVINHDGDIVFTNKAWRTFAKKNPTADGSPPRDIEVGSNYLDVCKKAASTTSENIQKICAGLQAVLDGDRRYFVHIYPCHSSEKQRWFEMKAKPLPRTSPREALIVHSDITERQLAELDARAKQQELTIALARLEELAREINKSVKNERITANTKQNSAKDHESLSHSAPLKSLSRREKEVFLDLIRGERNSEIATRLNLSRKSISTYRVRILEKLGLENDAGLFAFATRNGWT